MDWENFQTAHPWVTGNEAEWRTRLTVALAATFADCNQPSRSKVIRPEWRTSTAIALARAISDGRAFDRLPILADALEEAGCDDAEVLAHCRGGIPHGTDCWVTEWLRNGIPYVRTPQFRSL